MKFGHTFQEALQGEAYPQHWVEKAIPYRQLKKILGKVREELITKGYDPDTLHKLLADHNAKYSLETSESNYLRPRLVVRPVLPISPPGSPDSWEDVTESEMEVTTPAPTRTPTPAPMPEEVVESKPTEVGKDDQETQSSWVKIPLDSDAKFFNVLQTDVDELDTLQTEERRSMNDIILALGNEISEVAKPRKGLIRVSKSDLYRWREIFELYLAAEVFFSTTETSGGVRNSEKARKQLVWFQAELEKRDILRKFKLETSINAYNRFLALNATLLQNVQFQELNQMAVVKIIKSKICAPPLPPPSSRSHANKPDRV